MYIESIAINNYKSFYAFPPLALGPGINVIVGPNNVGKTALLEILSGNFEDHPHRSRKTAPGPTSRTDLYSNASVRIHLDAGEAKQLLIDSVDGFTVPTNEPNRRPARAQEVLAALEQPDTFVSVWIANGTSTGNSYLQSLHNTHNSDSVGFVVNRSGTEHTLQFQDNYGAHTYDVPLLSAIRQRIYMFRAARSHAGLSTFGTSKVLNPDASNLAEVLHNLQSNERKFTRLNQHIHDIFPDIGKIGVPSGPSALQVQILVWPASEADTDREDLAIPLIHSGTGVSQVLAMLYVVLFADYPRIIIIDEPQSFLNPGAVRKLFDYDVP